MKVVWLIVATSCGLAAAALLWRGNSDAAFVVVVIGIVAWFLNYRVHARAMTAESDDEENQARDLDDDQ